jgi:hypothetical protein
MVMAHIVELLVDHDENHVSTPLLIIELETLVPFWAISDTLAHQTSVLAWEELVILDQIYEIWNFAYVSNVVVVAFLAILLLVANQYCLSLQYLLFFSTSSIKSLSPHHHQIKTLELFFWLS